MNITMQSPMGYAPSMQAEDSRKSSRAAKPVLATPKAMDVFPTFITMVLGGSPIVVARHSLEQAYWSRVDG